MLEAGLDEVDADDDLTVGALADALVFGEGALGVKLKAVELLK